MKNVFLCGDDKRFIECKKYLKKDKINTLIINKISDIDKEIKPQIIVLPISGINVITSLYHYLFSKFNDALFLYYNLTDEMKKSFDEYHLNFLDLSQNFKFSKENNIATAEASIKYIIENINKNFKDTKVAILGYGKCGKEVYDLYKKLGMKCNVFVRREEVKNKLNEDGFFLNELSELIELYDLIVNTIPSNVIDIDMLHKISLNTVLLDLSSYPYGWNHEVASYLGLYSYILKGLPAKHRYISIGKELANVIRESI